jgi:hypothetical protein
MKNYYQTLGLPENASADTIKQRFRELAFEYHPDVSEYKNAEEMFIGTYEAYLILSDARKKQAYDLLYDKYIKGHDNLIPDEENFKNEIINEAGTARKKAAQKVKISYKDFIKEFDCFFTSGQKADGLPYSYNMHKNVGISGGQGPMGSIKSKTVSIPVPRSRKALLMHRIGFLIKLSAFVIATTVLKLDLIPKEGKTMKIVIFISILLAGGLFTQVFYYLNKTKSKFLHASRFPLVKKYSENGYKRGFHPMISTTPVGILTYLLRLLF